MVFGRGGEEALALVAAKVPFRIVPGISAGIGGLAYAGIPVTHREINSAVTFVTGHDATGDVPDSVNWAALAQSSPVLVIYMALKHIERIASLLIEGGRSAQEPVAIVCHATLPEQQVLETTLGRCAADAEAAKLEPPAMVVVGEVVRLRAALDWLGASKGRELTADPLGTRRQTESA
jgi:uroporphyrin-III C-methyltransferase